MGYIPDKTTWYTAELIEEITVDGEASNVVHKNLVLIHAESAEAAYQRAVELGRGGEISYDNPAGKQVSIKFRGVTGLDAIHDELDHGAELLYEEKIGVPSEEIESWLVPKERLNAFRPPEMKPGPDYSAKEILDEVKHLMDQSSE